MADRHYNRQKVGSPQFVPPGRCLVFKADRALWVTSWPEFRSDRWQGAWVNSIFRKEGDGVASEFIREALAATRAAWPEIPSLGCISFIDPNEVQQRRTRGRLAIGISYFEAGFVHVGYTKAGLWEMQITAERMPEPELAHDTFLLAEAVR